MEALPINTTAHRRLTYKGRDYTYSVRNIGADEDSNGAELYHVICRAAGINQEFLLEDVDGIIDMLGECIDSLQADRNALNTLTLRLTDIEKEQIKSSAHSRGVSMSEYVRSAIFTQ